MRDYPGHDLRMFQNFNAQRCADECSKVLVCEGFQFQYLVKRCWIKKIVKSSGSNFRHFQGGLLYMKNIKINLPGYWRFPGKDYYGHDVRHFNNYNRENCGIQCSRNRNCLAFEFNINTRTCWIKRQGRTIGPDYKNHPHGELFIKDDISE